MKYRDILGYDKEKTPTKEKQLKPKKNQLLEGIKTDLNEFGEKMFKQELKEVGSAAEYRPHIKKINKLYDEYWDSVKDFQKLLGKKGLNQVSGDICLGYMKFVTKFHKMFQKMVRKLL